jgi:hypothetical protein
VALGGKCNEAETPIDVMTSACLCLFRLVGWYTMFKQRSLIRGTATVGLLGFLSILSVFSQGTILFNNRVTGKVDAPVGYFGSSYGPGPIGRAQLVMVSENGIQVPLFPITTFRENRTNFPSYVGMYVVEPSVPVIVPGYRPGDEVTVRLRAWSCSEDYGGAGVNSQLGASNPIKIILGGTNMNGTVTPPAPLVGLQGFTVLIIRPPARVNSVSIENDTLLLDASSPYYRRYILEATANFVQWEQITTNWYECAPITFRIPLFGANDTQTFYRLNAD